MKLKYLKFKEPVITVHYVYDSVPIVKIFANEDQFTTFIKKFKDDFNGGYWIDTITRNMGIYVNTESVKLKLSKGCKDILV